MKTNSNKIGIAARLLRAGAIAAIIFSMAACDTGFQHVNKPGQNPGTGQGNAITKDDLANVDRSQFDGGSSAYVPVTGIDWGSVLTDGGTESDLIDFSAVVGTPSNADNTTVTEIEALLDGKD